MLLFIFITLLFIIMTLLLFIVVTLLFIFHRNKSYIADLLTSKTIIIIMHTMYK